MSTETKQTSDRAELAATCRLVAGFWLHEVDQNALQLFADDRVQAAWIDLGGSLPASEPNSAATLDELAADYCQLLIGPKQHLPPVQSVWTDHVFQSKAASATHKFYELCSDFERPGTIDDHLGCQLHFAGFLLEQADHDEAAEQVLVQFQREHLSWASPLVDRVAQKAETDFYRGLAVVTQQLIKELAS